MKFGLRIPSLSKRIAARTSWKRVVRHSLGVKMPRGYGFISSPRKALYNKIYNRTSVSIYKPLKSINKSKLEIKKNTTKPLVEDDAFSITPSSFIQLINKPSDFGQDGWATLLIIISFFLLGNPIVGVPLLIVGIYWLHNITKQPWFIIKSNTRKAVKFLKKNDFNQALVPLQNAINLQSNNNELNYLLGVTLLGINKNENAIEHLKIYINNNPQDLDANLVLAYTLYKNGMFKEVISILQKFSPEYVNFLLVIIMLGDSFLNLHEFDLAIETFKRGPLRKINLDRHLLQLHYLLGQAYKEKGQKANALKEFKRVYSFDINYKNVGSELSAMAGM